MRVLRFASGKKLIELNLSKNKFDVAHVNELIRSRPTVEAIDFSSRWCLMKSKEMRKPYPPHSEQLPNRYWTQ